MMLGLIPLLFAQPATIPEPIPSDTGRTSDSPGISLTAALGARFRLGELLRIGPYGRWTAIAVRRGKSCNEINCSTPLPPHVGIWSAGITLGVVLPPEAAD